MTPALSLTFAQFRAANIQRCLKWHPEGIESWSGADWLTAVFGELGELGSLLKMRNRERDGLPGNKFSPTHKHIADELADVFTYLDLFHASSGGSPLESSFDEVARWRSVASSPSRGYVALCYEIGRLTLGGSRDVHESRYKDVLAELFALARLLGVDLAAATVSKFNEVSERVGFPDRIVFTAEQVA